MKNKNPLFLIENSRTDFLLKHPSARRIYGNTLKFLNSKYAFPIVMHSYGWGTIMLPSGSMYTIALGSIPQQMRKNVLYQLRHAKSSKDALNVLKTLSDEGVKVVKNTKEKISDSLTDTVAKISLPKQQNLLQYNFLHV